MDAGIVKAARRPPGSKAESGEVSTRKHSQKDYDAPLTKRGRQGLNKHKMRVRSAVERIFVQLKQHYGFRRVRYVKLLRNEVQFKFLCMIYNLRPSIHLPVATEE